MAALDEAGVEPEVFLPEYGRDQFEVSCAPAIGEASADRAVAVREITREIARLNGLAATFAPKTSEDGVGNGVHLHLSFRDKNGAPTLFDAGRDIRTFFDSVDHAARAECGLRCGRKPWLNPIKSAS